MSARHDRLTVLYDAECGVCRLTVRALRTLDWNRRLELVPLQRFVRSATDDPTRRRLLSALHARDARGGWYRAGDAMLRIAAVVPVLAPLSIIGRLPGMGRPIEAVYRLVAGNRHAISRLLEAIAVPLRGFRPGG